MNPAYIYGQKLAEDVPTQAPPPAPYSGALPPGMILPEGGEHMEWTTPKGHTVRMPFRDTTLQGHLNRLGPEGTRGVLQNAMHNQSRETDGRITAEQAAFFNQHPRLRNGLTGAILGTTIGGALGSATGSLKGVGYGALAGLLGGVGLSQLGTPHQRKGPEVDDHTEADPRTLPKEFYQLSHLERRQMERQDQLQEEVDRANRRLRHHDIYGTRDRYGYDPYGYDPYGY